MIKDKILLGVMSNVRMKSESHTMTPKDERKYAKRLRLLANCMRKEGESDGRLAHYQKSLDDIIRWVKSVCNDDPEVVRMLGEYMFDEYSAGYISAAANKAVRESMKKK